MKILIYTIFYPAPEGMRTKPDTLVIHYFAQALQRMGHTVQVIHLSCSALPSLFRNRFRDIIPTETDYVYDGIPVHLFRIMTLIPHQSNPQRFQAAWIDRRLKKLKDRLGWKPDKVFVHFPTVFTGIQEIFADGAPVLGDFHNIDILLLNKQYLFPSLRRQIAAYIRQIDHWGYRNFRVRDGLKRIDDRPMIRTCSGLDSGLPARQELIQEKCQRFSSPLQILYAGQLIPLKHVDLLIQAVQELDFPWKLTIVGSGPEEDRLRSLSAGNPNIHFTGQLPRSDVIAEMRNSDVFIMLSSPETYGLVYLEAMAQGCLTIASRGEGFDGLIRDQKNGFLAAPGSVAEAKKVLEKVHSLSQAERSRIIQAGYQFALSMTEERTAQAFLDADS